MKINMAAILGGKRSKKMGILYYYYLFFPNPSILPRF
jgi:hypothetical protein